MGAASFSLNSLNIIQYGLKTCLSCQTILMLLSTGGSRWCIFSLGVTPQICETMNYEYAKSKGWVCILFVFSLLNSAVSISAFASPSNQMTAMKWKGHGRMWFDIIEGPYQTEGQYENWARKVSFLTEIWTRQLLQTSQTCCHCGQENTFFSPIFVSVFMLGTWCRTGRAEWSPYCVRIEICSFTNVTSSIQSQTF